MTAVKSTDKSFFGTRFLNGIKENKKHLIVNIVLELLGFPVLSIISVIMLYIDGQETGGYAYIANACIPFMIIAICTIIGSVLMGAMIALFHFRYLYKKTIADMNYSLPLNSTQRFFADYLSGLTVYIAPIISAILLSLIILLGIGGIITDISEVLEVMPRLLSLAGMGIVAMIQYYTIAVFALTFCGSTFEANSSVVAFIVMIPATIGCLWLAIVNTSTFGIAPESIFYSSIFTTTNPAGSVAFLIEHIDTMFYENNATGQVSKCLKWVFITLIVTAVYMGIAYILHKYRKAEDISKPYVYRAFFYALMTMVTFCIISLFIVSDGFIPAGIVICAVIWFIMEIITRRGFKKFWTVFVGFGLSVISVFAICWICYISDGFGMSKRLPASMSVSNVEIFCSGISEQSITYKDRDVINSALELNKEIIDMHFNPDDYTFSYVSQNDDSDKLINDSEYIRFSYRTLTGSLVIREYYINSGMTDRLATAILLSDDYAEYSATNIGYIYNEYSAYSYHDSPVKKCNLEITDSLKMNVIEGRITVTERQINDLRKAYVTDMKNMTEEDLLNGKVYCFLDDFWVLDSFENTINTIDADISPITAESFEKNGTYSVKAMTYPVYMYNSSGVDIFPDKDTNISVDKIVHININEYYYMNDMQEIGVLIDSTNIIDVLKNCRPFIIGENPIALFMVDGYLLYLPDTPENRNMLENIELKDSYNSTYNNYYWD